MERSPSGNRLHNPQLHWLLRDASVHAGVLLVALVNDFRAERGRANSSLTWKV
jgi:hypothetical protein